MGEYFLLDPKIQKFSQFLRYAKFSIKHVQGFLVVALIMAMVTSLKATLFLVISVFLLMFPIFFLSFLNMRGKKARFSENEIVLDRVSYKPGSVVRFGSHHIVIKVGGLKIIRVISPDIKFINHLCRLYEDKNGTGP